MSFRHRLVVLVVLQRPVADNLPPAEHLADGEEADDLSGDDAEARPLSGGHVADAVEQALGLLAGRLGLLEELARARLGEEVLEVALEGSNVTGASISNLMSLAPFSVMARRRRCLRRAHFPFPDNDLAHLDDDLGVVDGRGNHGCTRTMLVL